MSVFSNPSRGAGDRARDYTRAVLELLGERNPLAVLRETPSRLPMIIADVTPSDQNRPEKPGKWSIAGVLQHLADSELVWGYRLRMGISEDRPTLTGFDQDRWADALNYNRADSSEAIDAFSMLRRHNLVLVDGLSEPDKRRAIVHAERGEETIELMVRLYAGHDLVHIRQIERIRAGLSVSG